MNQTLLIIDDDRATHDLVAANLANGQTECISSLNGIDGIARAVDANPTAILLDVDMPDLSGMEVCRQLKANPKTRKIPIVFLSGDSATTSKVKGIEMGAADYVTKPFDPFELRARVRCAFRSANEINSAHALAGIDESTGTWSRKFLAKQIEMSLALASRNRQQVSCCLASIDRYDELAAKLGNPGGESMMCEAAERIRAAVRLEDIVCRYDTRILGVIGIVPDGKTARIQAERLRGCIGEVGLRSFIEPETVTFSVGQVVSRNSAGPAILRAAERALAEAQLTANHIVLLDPDRDD